jgi:cyclic beta-1,2-glucan synthetase
LFCFVTAVPAASAHTVWDDRTLIREEVFGEEGLERLAESIAAAEGDAGGAPRSLEPRLAADAAALREACRIIALAGQSGPGLEPAAVRFLDNFHLIDEQVRAAHDELTPRLCRRLPRLSSGPLAGYPRLLALAWAFVAHTDSYVDLQPFRAFCMAYQKFRPLTIGEIRALPAILRFVLIENSRRLADEIVLDRESRAQADLLADQWLGVGADATNAVSRAEEMSGVPLPDVALAQLVKRLRDRDPHVIEAQQWLDGQIARRNASVDEIVHNAHRRYGSGNVTLRNIIASMRLLSDDDWAAFLSSISVVDESFRALSSFSLMDFDTRNLYRDAVEALARGSGRGEREIVEQACAMFAGDAPETVSANSAVPARDPGFYLIGEGREALQRAVGFRRNPLQRLGAFAWRRRRPIYIGGAIAANLLILALMLYVGNVASRGAFWLVALALAGLLPAAEAAIALVNRAVIGIVGPSQLPGLELADGVPSGLRTLVVIPTLLTTPEELQQSIVDLEVHYLANRGGELSFALLVDGIDADQETLADEPAIYANASRIVAALNEKYGRGPGGNRFLLLHRRRLFNQSERRWMGWERKRGKLHELNRLLRGAEDTTFVIDAETSPVPADVRYVVTLDADTRLPRGSVTRLIGKMAHPLNRPRFDEKSGRVVEGYAILQPRVTASLPTAEEETIFQWAFSSPGGMDPYAGAVSDVYQDLFGEGTYTGKGIYDVDAFETALAGRIPDNALLSHDLFEGSFARAGLASDIEFVEQFPSRYDVAVKRQHRWARGDWQLLPFLNARLRGSDKQLSVLAVWKMLDNLRRTLTAPLTFAALALGWMAGPDVARIWSAVVIGALALPSLLPVALDLVPRIHANDRHAHWRAAAADLRFAVVATLLRAAFLADQTYRMADAIVRTIYRLYVSRRDLLEWMTAAQIQSSPELGLTEFARYMVGGIGLSIAAAVIAVWISPRSFPVVALFTLAWCAAPVVAMLVSRRTPSGVNTLSDSEARALRLIARRTWRYFETYATPAENMLPPDNFQESPVATVARRTSPTNLGLHLLSAAAARDFGWAGQGEIVERLELSLAAMGKLKRFRGHFYNWYETAHMEVLGPAYISTVDSGNLAGNLIALANACREWKGGPIPPERIRAGLGDDLALASEALAAISGTEPDSGAPLRALLADLSAQLAEPGPIDMALPGLASLGEKTQRLARTLAPDAKTGAAGDLVFWTQSFARSAAAHRDDDRLQPGALDSRLEALENSAREMALAMEFDFLLEPQRKMLSIGFSVPDNRLDTSCYDLLASESRLACLFAIAKGDVGVRLWARLGRRAVDVDGGYALLSWSGSMFEYLMAGLMLRAPANSLLDQSNHAIVARQRSYARALNLPWGISESGYNARDLALNYQYRAFGVPDLAMKRGLASDAVIAPYATGLAAMIDPRAALENYSALADIGAVGRYGFYEAIDFTRSRLPENEKCAIIRNYMAHHQGMTIVAVANVLHRGRMRDRFHREPMIQACELLLHEPATREARAANPIEEIKVAPNQIDAEMLTERRLGPPVEFSPQTHILSNGAYSLMLTSAGSGYSRWNDLSITRWREDAARDDWGSYIFARDVTRGVRTGPVWSATYQPIFSTPSGYEALFSEDRAEFKRNDGPLTTTLEIIVSADANAEVRRVTLTNSERQLREIELTSYAELALAADADDSAHPAFSKMFVETEHNSDNGVLIATRRRRSADDPNIWAAHFAVVEGRATAPASFETDRARFLGRGRTLSEAAAIAQPGPLSNSCGTVLDPVFSLRQRVLVPPLGSVKVAFWTIAASSRDELLAIVQARLDADAVNRARINAWTQAQVALLHRNVTTSEATHFQRLAGSILYADARLRPSSDTILRGAGPQSNLWRHGISGDRPIVLVRIDDFEDLEVVSQLVRAFEFWREKLLRVDLVILNERTASYMQDLQNVIESIARSANTGPRAGEQRSGGAIFTLRTDIIGAEARAHLLAASRIVLIARHGDVARQIARLPAAIVTQGAEKAARASSTPATSALRAAQAANLELFNGFGGFDKNGREYVIVLDEGRATPAPWINVIANPAFGFQTSADGAGYTWSLNSRDNQITAWSNDPVIDPPGEALYLRDQDNGDIWSPTAAPIRDNGLYVARHGFGYSRFEHAAHEIESELLQFAPLADPVKVQRLTLKNRSQRPRRIALTYYLEWVLGQSRAANAPFISTRIDAQSGALFASNPWIAETSARVAFLDLCGAQTSWTADRRQFIGRNGSMRRPAAIMAGAPLSGRTGAGLDPCAALQCVLTLAPGQQAEVTILLGECADSKEAQALIERFRSTDLDEALAEVERHWSQTLGSVQVRTPDRAMDMMLNGWLLYQTLACRITARSAFYQASGAFGFRDQLQDHMALTLAQPRKMREHLLRAASRQFAEGDVQHWWLPSQGQGVRTKISDDRVWLAYCAAHYIEATGDAGVLDERLGFLEGRAVGEQEHDAFYQPDISQESASVFEHCARGLDQSVALTGARGLPLMGAGDWNDGMNRVGALGKGESVWLGWFLIRAIDLFAPLAQSRDPARARRWTDHRESVRASIEREAWDGDWYKRAWFDDGTPLGSSEDDECRIDSIAQSWSVISGAADPARGALAMESLQRHLAPDAAPGLVLLFTPPFDKTSMDPGYIKGYPPGLRENGGQYTHAATWAVIAHARLGQGNLAGAMFDRLNPLNHARTASDAQVYRIEPYVVAGDIYSVAPNVGRGGWSWYTGSASWLYRAGVEAILGIERHGSFIWVDPCIPAGWPGFKATVRFEGATIEIEVTNPERRQKGVAAARLDGAPIATRPPRAPLDGANHRLEIELG